MGEVSYRWLRQAQPPGDDRLSHRSDRLSHRSDRLSHVIKMLPEALEGSTSSANGDDKKIV